MNAYTGQHLTLLEPARRKDPKSPDTTFETVPGQQRRNHTKEEPADTASSMPSLPTEAATQKARTLTLPSPAQPSPVLDHREPPGRTPLPVPGSELCLLTHSI
ncbi:hypothetical protein PMIN04_008216 [Paraphaeosphaeria minitans]